jgi:hypothetical protein
MTKLLYWVVYHLDLGPLGPKVLDLAVRTWLRRAKAEADQPLVRRGAFGFLTIFHIEPSFRDERM